MGTLCRIGRVKPDTPLNANEKLEVDALGIVTTNGSETVEKWGVDRQRVGLNRLRVVQATEISEFAHVERYRVNLNPTHCQLASSTKPRCIVRNKVVGKCLACNA